MCNFQWQPGEACCGPYTTVAAGDVNGWVRLIRNKKTKWYRDIETPNAIYNVAVLDKHTVVAIDMTKLYIVDSTGVVFSAEDSSPSIAGGRSAYASGLRVRGGKIYAVAGPPYRADAVSLSVEVTYPVTFGIAQDMTVIHDCEVDSQGACYIIGSDVGNPFNPPQYMMRKFDSSGASEWDLLKSDYSATASAGGVSVITIDESDNIYIFMRVDFSDGSHLMQIEKRGPSGSVAWAVPHAEMSIRSLCYGHGFLWVRASSGVFEKYDTADGSLVATYSDPLLGNNFFNVDPHPKRPFVILGKTNSDVVEYDPNGPVLKWFSSNSLGVGVSSLDAKLL